MESEDERVMESEDESVEVEKISKRLFKLCMKGKWEKTVEMYKRDKMARVTKITRTGETALHIAVTDGQDDVVEELVKLICNCGDKEGLRIQNERGNTALHFAASMGSVQICECIASSDASLLSVRNIDGETPLFLASLNGRKDAFLSLHSISYRTNPNPAYDSNSRRNDGETILHSAIAGDYFDLAFQIIQLDGELVNRVNERGESPLHLLASKPSVFKSGSRLGRFEAIVYHGK
ncbi:ankyrin repeat-containing protein At5g02620-like [Abrus precatorius]|uniref:Ankyrin repeat-containing protein At5g02620-like n=1 Tax=Abrus precatorius TaxID=3816 RepID=A0A8B8K4B4_ABRPR|nr:ankyrin repeat-containing protein At5g02620-like [Abrus precatorius]